MKGTPFKLKQKLSKGAALKKAARDLAMAKTPARSDSDLHHTGSAVKRVSIKNNRGNYGRGTKNE